MITGITAEYNIFHNGHKYQIDEIKKRSDAVVAVMSGSFVQRGDVTVTDKWTRAKTALMCGVDLVIELPACYALNAAPNFASGAVGIMNALGVIDSIAFGSESGDISQLRQTAQIMENEETRISDKIKKYISDGLCYPAAISKAYDGLIDSRLLSQPNNILAVEYIRAIIRTGSNITPVTIERRAAGHHDTLIRGNIASASKIREMIADNEDISALIPYDLSEISENMPYSLSRLDCAVISKLRGAKSGDLTNISEMTEGLENRIIKAAMENDNFVSLADAVKSKCYTMSKIRRILLASLLDFTKDIYSPLPEYIRVLGMNKTGADILKRAKKVCSVPIITKAADFKRQSPQFELDIRATDIAALCAPNPQKRMGGMDFKTSPVIM